VLDLFLRHREGYKLTQLSAFAGTYFRSGAGFTVAGGGTALYLIMNTGVASQLLSTDVGLKFICRRLLNVALKN